LVAVAVAVEVEVEVVGWEAGTGVEEVVSHWQQYLLELAHVGLLLLMEVGMVVPVVGTAELGGGASVPTKEGG
jgi:hypothetical protein